jgi:CRP/FNR family transcriptional regulator
MVRLPDVNAMLRRSPVFGVLGDAERMTLIRAGTALRYRAGADLFRVGDRGEEILVLVRGRVRLWRATTAGQVLVLRLCPQGEILGQMSALEEGAHSVNATAEEDVEVFRISASRFRGLLGQNAPAALRLAQVLAERVRELSDDLEAMKFSTIGERVLRRVRTLARGRCELRVTHQALADQVGSTRENVTRVLDFLRDQGILALRRGAIEILDGDRLATARFEQRPV